MGDKKVRGEHNVMNFHRVQS